MSFNGFYFRNIGVYVVFPIKFNNYLDNSI